MANRRNRMSIVSLLAIGLVPLWLVACGGGESTTGTGGSGPGTGGSGPGTGGSTGTAGSSGGTTGTGGSGTGGGAACPAGTTATYGCGAQRTMGYMGCSMSVNVATGYQTDGGKRMWEPISAYGGQVVQSWTPTSGGPWSAFDQKVQQYGAPTDIWMQICIFGSAGVTDAEVQTMIKNARSHSTANTVIWVTGQPQYEAGHTCTLAGTGGSELTDTRAKAADNPSNNVHYAGTF